MTFLGVCYCADYNAVELELCCDQTSIEWNVTINVEDAVDSDIVMQCHCYDGENVCFILVVLFCVILTVSCTEIDC